MSNKEFIKIVSEKLKNGDSLYDWILNNRYNLDTEQLTRLLLELYCVYDKDEMTTRTKNNEIIYQLNEYLGDYEEE